MNFVWSLLEFQTAWVGFGPALLCFMKVVSSAFSGLLARAAGGTVAKPVVAGCLSLSYAACCLAGVGAT